MTLDPNLALVLVAIVGILVPLATLFVNFIQNRSIAKEQQARALTTAAEVRNVAVKVEEARHDRAAAAVEAAAVAVETRVSLDASRARVDERLDVIYTLVNGRLTQALNTIEELKRMLQQHAQIQE